MDEKFPSDVGPLQVGQLYRVQRAFLDAEGTDHPLGEAWVYLAYSRNVTTLSLTLEVRTSPEGQRKTIVLPSSSESAGAAFDLSVHLHRVSDPPPGYVLRCHCEDADALWETRFPSRTLEVDICLHCSLVIAVEHSERGVRLLPMDNQDRALVLQARDACCVATFPRLLEAYVACGGRPVPVALVLEELSNRTDLDRELTDAVSSTDRALREAALAFLACAPAVPAGIETALVRIFHAPLTPDPGSAEMGSLLKAMARVPERIIGHRPEIAELHRSLRRATSATAQGVRELARNLLGLIDRELERRQEKQVAAAAVLRALALRSSWDEAHEWLERCRSLGGGHELINQGHLCERAADTALPDAPRAAAKLYRMAQKFFEAYAQIATEGEAALRYRHVKRVAQKLHQPPIVPEDNSPESRSGPASPTPTPGLPRR